MTATTSPVTEETLWIVRSNGPTLVTATPVNGQTVVYVDGTPATPLPAESEFLSDFLDKFDTHPDIAVHLPNARMEFASERIAGTGKATLRDLRLVKGLSQKEFAELLQTSQSRVSLLESRKEKPSEDTIRAIASILDVDFNTLMTALKNADTSR